MKNRIIVTGAAGFIGAHTAKLLLENNHEVIGIDNLNDYYNPQLKRDRINHLLGKNFINNDIDIANYQVVHEICLNFKPNYIVHLAAQAGVHYSQENPSQYLDTNIKGFLNILEISKVLNVKKVIYASSSSVYGGNTKLPFVESDRTDDPLNFYAVTKKCNELMATAYNHMYDLRLTGLRFFTAYGPWGRPDMAITKFTDAIINQKQIELYHGGLHRRDFTYIDDISSRINQLIEVDIIKYPNRQSENQKSVTGSGHEVFNIGNQNPVLVKDIVSSLEKIIGKKAILNFREKQNVDALDTFSDNRKINNFLITDKSTSIDEGLSRYVEWHRNYYS